MKQLPRLPLVYSAAYSIPWDPEHRFPMAKYRLLYEHLHQHGIAQHSNTFTPEPCTRTQLLRAHDASYVDAFMAGKLDAAALRQLGFPWSPALVNRSCTAVGGSIATAQLALRQRLACHLAGGTHHAFRDRGQGFCVFNDLAVTALALLAENNLQRVLILDCDVHQGDGTAAILADEPRAFTCSLHGAYNYPFEKQRSDLDIALADGLDDAGYLSHLQQALAQLDHLPRPDILLYDGGSDVHHEDRLGRLALTDDGIRQRDWQVLEWAYRHQIPTACYIGGGYDRDHQRLIRRHALLIETADAFYRQHLASTTSHA
ncbi:MAG TPA: histone deacetylase [Motiliproteus sp.]